MDHHGQRPIPGDEDAFERIMHLHGGHIGKNTFQANIVSPVEPIGTDRYQ